MSGESAGTDHYGSLLADFSRYSDQRLAQRLTGFLDALLEYLTELSHSPQAPGIGRGSLMDCISLLRQRRAEFPALWIGELGRFRADLHPPLEQRDQWWDLIEGGGTLDLVDLNAFEDFLAQERVVTIGEDLHRTAMEALQIRVAELAGLDPHRLRLPEHVAQLTRALQRTLEVLRVPARTLPRIFECFIREFIRPLEADYRAMNQWLAERGIRPSLEQEIHSRGSLLHKPAAREVRERRRRLVADMQESAPDRAHEAQAGGPANPPAAGQSSGRTGSAFSPRSPEALYQSVLRALEVAPADTDAGRASGAAGNDKAEPEVILSQTRLHQSLATFQQQDPALILEQLQQAGSLLAWLDAQVRQMPEATALDQDSRSRLQLVENLFSTLVTQFSLHEALHPTIELLRIPLARLALKEPHFFLDPEHPARRLMDELAVLANSSNFPNRMLEQRLQAIAADIAEHYDGNSAVFVKALEQLHQLAGQQASALNRNIERVVAARDGKSRLEQARMAVDQLIGDTLPAPEAPGILLELLACGWRDLMVLTRVKQGPDSDDWLEQTSMLQQLTDWLAEHRDGALDAERLVQQGLEAEPFIELLEQQINSAGYGTPDLARHLASLRAILGGDTPVMMAPSPPTPAAGAERVQQRRERIEKTRRLRRWVRRVEQLAVGSWLSYRDREQRPQRMQLAWISDDGEHYLFVNERGQKVAELDRVALARKLSHGAQPPTPEERLPVVDRSLYSTLESAQRRLSFARNHDQVTRLINREAFEGQLERALQHAQQHAAEHALLLLDIDSFRLVNEVYDRVLGDEVLEQFSRMLAQLHERSVSTARLEADRFALLLANHDQQQAMAVAEQVRGDIAEAALAVEGEAVRFTVAIGVTAIRDYSPDTATLLQQAQDALRHAKHEGGNRVCHWREDQATITRQRRERQHSRRALEEALDGRRFALRAQPIVQTAVGGQQPSSRHYELLLSLLDRDGNPTSPLPFIQSAERYRLMPLVDRWVVKEAFRWVSSLMDAQKVVPAVAINLSGSSVTDDSFMDFLFEQISEFGVGTNRLCFEITEVGTISNLTRAADFVRAFRNIGCKFSIDDFGTGLESHNYLRELPVDYVKIDGSFITGLQDNPGDLAMARAINDLAHFLGQETIAECVENNAVIEQLRQIGVDYLQGWGVGRPVLLEEVARDLSQVAT